MNQKEALAKHLFSFITTNKQKLFEEILSQRTKHITVVLEDVFQPQNASAVIRSCDCFGVQDMHVIETHNTYQINPRIVMGASKWVDVHHHDSTATCIDSLKAEGFQIVATTPHTDDTDVFNFIPYQKCALFFGTEQNGLTKEVMEKADSFVKIPMYGFTESFNISVAAALTLSATTNNLRTHVKDWQLTDQEKEVTRINWAKKCLNGADIIEQNFLESNP